VKPHLFIAAVLVILAIVGGPVSAAPVVWSTTDGGNGHTYEVVAAPETLSWDAARAAAQARGGDLATITSPAENAFVFDLVDSPDYWIDYDGHIPMGPWLGGFQPLGSPEPAGGWEWVTGEPFAFTNWAPGQPSNTSGEDRLHFFVGEIAGQRGPTWNDVQNNGQALPRAYVVEYVPEPGGAAMFLVALSIVLSRRRSGVSGRRLPPSLGAILVPPLVVT
jgi:hypothetical protein